jgi:nitric oxide reductase subunit C
MRNSKDISGKAGGFLPLHRRLIFFGLTGLFVVQTFLTWSTSTAVPEGRGTLNEQALRGRTLFNQFNCTACHQVYGLGGYMGPDLTNVTTHKGAEYAKALIMHGSGTMPALGVTADEADDLVAYLEAMAASGIYPIRELDATWYGTYTEMHGDE